MFGVCLDGFGIYIYNTVNNQIKCSNNCKSFCTEFIVSSNSIKYIDAIQKSCSVEVIQNKNAL